MRHFILALLFTATLAGCQQRDLDYELGLMCSADVRASWELEWEYGFDGGKDWQTLWPQYKFAQAYDALRPAVPDGLRVAVYSEGYDMLSQNLPATGGEVFVREDSNTLLFYNNDTEYIVFNDERSSLEVSATTRTRTRSTYIGSPYTKTALELTVNPPDHLWGSYISNYAAAYSATTIPQQAVTMKPLVFTYYIRFNFDAGLEYVVLARGALAGMARSVYLYDGHTGSETATVLFDINGQDGGTRLHRSTGAPASSRLEVAVNSFGAPNFPNPYYNTRTESRYGLNLEVMLKNGKMLTFDFDITDQIQSQPRGGVIDVGGITVTAEQAAEGSGGGFDVDVCGWGEYEDVNIQF